MATNSPQPVSPEDIYSETLALGGSVLQADVATALASGIESGIGGGYGEPQSLELSGGVGPAQGLFQFEPGTWTGGAGGGRNGLPGTVAAASWQQQIQGFINDTGGPGGHNFGAWGPDVVADRGDPNSSSNPAYGYSGGVQSGSLVGSIIARSAAFWAQNVEPGTPNVGGAAPALTAAAGGANATLTGLNANPFDLFGIPQAGASALWSVVGPFLVKSMLVIGGLGLVVLGLYKAAGGDPKADVARVAKVSELAAAA